LTGDGPQPIAPRSVVGKAEDSQADDEAQDVRLEARTRAEKASLADVENAEPRVDVEEALGAVRQHLLEGRAAGEIARDVVAIGPQHRAGRELIPQIAHRRVVEQNVHIGRQDEPSA